MNATADRSRRMMARTVLILAVAACSLSALASCASIQTDVRYDGPAGTAPAALESLELRLVSLRANPDPAALAQVRSELEALSRTPSTDQAWLARVLALRADAELLSGDRQAAARMAAQALEAWGGDELAALAGARLAADDAERLALLERYMQVSDGALRLRAELGATLSRLGRHRDALAAFDAALPFLAPEYGFLYGAERDRAWALKDSAVAPGSASTSFLTGDPIPLAGMVALTVGETGSLDWFTGGAPWDPGVLFERLKAAGWFADPSAPGSTPATRKDAALFLWSLMARGEAAMRTRYTVRYAARGSSPVPDVPYASPWFDGVVGTVEEGIMALVDGRNFSPDAPASGLDFFNWLLAAAAWR